MIEKIEIFLKILNIVKEIKLLNSLDRCAFMVNLDCDYLEFIEDKSFNSFIFRTHFYILSVDTNLILISDRTNMILSKKIIFDNIIFPISDPLEFVLEYGRVDLSNIHILNLKLLLQDIELLYSEYKENQ